MQLSRKFILFSLLILLTLVATIGLLPNKMLLAASGALVPGNLTLTGSRIFTGLDGATFFWVGNKAGTEPSNVAFGYTANPTSGTVNEFYVNVDPESNNGNARMIVTKNGMQVAGTVAANGFCFNNNCNFSCPAGQSVIGFKNGNPVCANVCSQ